MVAAERWIAGQGQGLTWGSAFGTEINSLPNKQSVASSIIVNNSTALDNHADLSISLGSAAFTTPNFLTFYIQPLNADGTTYADGRVGPTVNLTGGNYWVGNITLIPATQVQVGQLNRIILPPGSFRFFIQSYAGVTLASSNNTIKYRTYCRGFY